MVHRLGCKISLAVLCSSREGLVLLEMFRSMVNDSIRIGLVNVVYSLRRLSLLSYNHLDNLTVGNDQETSHYDLSKCVRIAKTIVRIATTTVRIVTSFTRNDDRIRTGLASKYGQRRAARLVICFTLRQRRLLQRHSSGEKQ